MTFLSPLFFGAMVLASVPVIIHLLNRRRFRRIDWAPMRYLKLTIKNNRRRLRLEQIILLAIRTLVVALLVLALARPVLSASGLGQLFGGRGRVSRVIVIDDSLSMGYVADGVTALSAAKSVAQQLVKSAGPQDSLTVLLTSSMDTPLVREAQVNDSAKVLDELARLVPSDTASNWSATFKRLDEYLRSATFPTRQLILLTDLRKAGWDTAVGPVAAAWAGQDISLRVIDVGSRQTANASVASLQLEDAAAIAQSPAQVQAVVRNQQASALAGGQALWQVADQERPVLLPEISAGQSATVPLSFSPTTAGPALLRFSLPSDALPSDDVRWLNVSVRPSLNVLLVDGEPGARPFESETDYLAVALTLGAVPWDVRRETEPDVGTVQKAPDVLVLANVATLSQQQVDSIEQQVRSGMGLMIFCGDLIDPQVYNDRLFKNGAGLLPSRLMGPADGPVAGLVLEQSEQSPLDALSKIAPDALTQVAARRYMSVEVPDARASQTRVLARWNDAEGRPAVLEKRFGKGRVVCWTMTADRAWSDWPTDPTYVLGVRSAALAIARPDRPDANVVAGQPIHFNLAAGERALEPRVVTPQVDTPVPIAFEGGALQFPRTYKAGIYRLTWKDAAGREQSQPICVNPDPAESNLEPLDDEQLRQTMGDVDVSIIHYGGTNIATDAAGREIWRTLAIAVLTLAAIETVFAVWVGRER